MVHLRWILLGLASVLPGEGSLTSLEPSHDAAKANAKRIFNALHAAGRQWGSSIHHNGFGFIPAVMPKGTLTYHGAHAPEVPTGAEWLAFEIEHAEAFGKSCRDCRSRPMPPASDAEEETLLDSASQVPMSGGTVRGGDMPPPRPREGHRGKNVQGYLHTYRANRDLNLLYLDGMSAGKTDMGTMDSQDLILRNTTDDGGVMDEWQRAIDICKDMTAWGYDGFVRAEVGFEVVYCDFSAGLDHLSSRATFAAEDKMVDGAEMEKFQWSRAVAERYDGIGGDRLRLDFSSMVSGLFFPMNLSSTVPDRPDLARLGTASEDDRRALKKYVGETSLAARRFTVDWQAVVDMVVSRYTERFVLMASDTVSMSHFIQELETSILLYVDAPRLEEDLKDQDGPGQQHHKGENGTEVAISRCTEHFLLPTVSWRDEWSVEDELIHTALTSVMSNICVSLFTMRSVLLSASGASDDTYRIRQTDNGDGDGDGDEAMRTAFALSKALLRSLMDSLRWTEWIKTPRCPVGEMLFVAMWPFGLEEDYWHPGCRSVEDMHKKGKSYWMDEDMRR